MAQGGRYGWDGWVRSFSESLSRSLTSRRGAWVWLVAGVLVLVALIGGFGRASMTASNQSAPPDSESARVAALADEFPGADERTLIVVASSTDNASLSNVQNEKLAQVAADLGELEGAQVLGPFPSEDGRAAVVQVTAPVTDEGTAADRVLVEEVRELVANERVDGVTLHVTGGPAFGVEVASAFDGADFTLLLVKIGIGAA